MRIIFIYLSCLETKSSHSQSHGHSHGPSAALYLDVLKQYLIEHFGSVREDEEEAKYRFELEVAGSDQMIEVAVSMEDFSIDCDDEKTKGQVQNVVQRITSLLDVDYIL